MLVTSEEILNNPDQWIKIDLDQLKSNPRSIIDKIFTEENYLNDTWVQDSDYAPPYNEWVENSDTNYFEPVEGELGYFYIIFGVEPDSWKMTEKEKSELDFMPYRNTVYKWLDPFGGHSVTFDVRFVNNEAYICKEYYLEG